MATNGIRYGTLVLAVSVLASLWFPLGAGQGGGQVSNKLPTVESFSNSASTVNEGTRDVLAGQVRDRNGESDLVALRVTTTSGPSVTATRLVTATDLAATLEPGTFDANGWKVWNTLPRDGRLDFKYEFPYPVAAAATYVWEAQVADQTGAYQTGPAARLTVAVVIRLTVSPPVSLSGALDINPRWGGWTADPGQTLLESTNFLKVTNTGATANQAFVMDFVDTHLRGVINPDESILIDGNLQVAWWEDLTPATTAPSEGVFVFGPTSPTGSATLSFTATGSVIYLKYRLVAIPDPLLDQDYQSNYTVTAV